MQRGRDRVEPGIPVRVGLVKDTPGEERSPPCFSPDRRLDIGLDIRKTRLFEYGPGNRRVTAWLEGRADGSENGRVGSTDSMKDRVREWDFARPRQRGRRKRLRHHGPHHPQFPFIDLGLGRRSPFLRTRNAVGKPQFQELFSLERHGRASELERDGPGTVPRCLLRFVPPDAPRTDSFEPIPRCRPRLTCGPP